MLNPVTNMGFTKTFIIPKMKENKIDNYIRGMNATDSNFVKRCKVDEVAIVYTMTEEDFIKNAEIKEREDLKNE